MENLLLLIFVYEIPVSDQNFNSDPSFNFCKLNSDKLKVVVVLRTASK